MKSTDDVAFATIVAKTWRFYGKEITAEVCEDWFDLLADFEIADIKLAFQKHLTDSEHGRFLPKPADIIRFLPARDLYDDNRPGPDEAWGMLLRLIQDERETGVLTDEMRAGWAACQPVLDLGDEVGARMAFLEVYSRRVHEARQRGQPARWTVTLGTDPALRDVRLTEAVEARRIGVDQAQALLPGPAPASLDQVAGLLEGPTASEQDRGTAERLRALAQMLRQGLADDAQKRKEQRQRDRENEEARRQDLLNQASQMGRPDSSSDRDAV